jgi:hypothetical protein
MDVLKVVRFAYRNGIALIVSPRDWQGRKRWTVYVGEKTHGPNVPIDELVRWCRRSEQLAEELYALLDPATRPPLLVCEFHGCGADEAVIHERRAKGRDTGEERALWAPAFGWSLGMLACPDCRKAHSLVSARPPDVPAAWRGAAT